MDKSKFNSDTLSYEPEWDGIHSKLSQFFRLNSTTLFLIQYDGTGISYMISYDDGDTWTTFWTK